MLRKRDIKGAISASLKPTEAEIQARIQRAEQNHSAKYPTPAASPEVAPPSQAVAERKQFSFTPGDLDLLQQLQQRCLDQRRHVTLSQVVRAGILAASRLDDDALLDLMAEVPALPTGRPKTS